MKYVIFENEMKGIMEPVIFGDHMSHSEVNVEGSRPVSAGYLMIDNDGIVSTYGNAQSLGLKPVPGDSALLSHVLHGMGAACFL